MTTLVAIEQQIADITHSKVYQRLKASHRDRQQQSELDKIELELTTLRARRERLAPAPTPVARRPPAQPTETRMVHRNLRAQAPPPPEPKMPTFVGKRPAGLVAQRQARAVTRGQPMAVDVAPEEPAPKMRMVRPPQNMVAKTATEETADAPAPMATQEEPVAPLQIRGVKGKKRSAAPTRLAPRAANVAQRPQSVARVVPAKEAPQPTKADVMDGAEEELERIMEASAQAAMEADVATEEPDEPVPIAPPKIRRSEPARLPPSDDFAVENMDDELPVLPTALSEIRTDGAKSKTNKGRKK